MITNKFSIAYIEKTLEDLFFVTTSPVSAASTIIELLITTFTKYINIFPQLLKLNLTLIIHKKNSKTSKTKELTINFQLLPITLT